MQSQIVKTNAFITEDFLLKNEFSRILYHDYAKDLPIIDYHSHLSPNEIANNHQFESLSEIWLSGDHYKWRAMRTLGVNEKFITGNATDQEKFHWWAHTVPFTIRNPLYHWTHLELIRYFNIHDTLSPETGENIFNDCNAKLKTSDFHTQSLIAKMNVELICSTDDPLDDLKYHRQIMSDDFPVKVLPTFRPDKAYATKDIDSYLKYLDQLSEVSGVAIENFTGLLAALEQRITYFHKIGCRLSDHGLEQIPSPTPGLKAEALFQKIRDGVTLSHHEAQHLTYSILLELGRMYTYKDWTQQFHLGALRNTNTRMMKDIGADAGFDSIGDFTQGESLSNFLNQMNSTDQLPKTILYNLNPADNEVLATMIGNFNDGSVRGKIQFGSAWWFLDQKDGMEKQLNTLSNLGLISCFIGMVTDSRSFLSFPRHEYFRRILCNLIGEDVANGELPADEKWLGKIVSDICYHNAKTYFNF
jgi:glucuronate isomerase